MEGVTYGQNMNGALMGHPITDTDQKVSERIAEIVKAWGIYMAVISLAWCLFKPLITLPIVGMSKKERVEEAIQAIDFKLGEEIKSIDELYVPRGVIGHR